MDRRVRLMIAGTYRTGIRNVVHRRVWLAWGLSVVICGLLEAGDAPQPNGIPQVSLPRAKPVPALQVIPLPNQRASIRLEDRELTCYVFGREHRRPFLFPIMGPSGRSLTRIGHPHDPVTHSHHNSVWIAHNDVDGNDFWSDHGAGTIQHRQILRYDDGDNAARIVAENHWVGAEDQPLLIERRSVRVETLPSDETRYILDFQMRAVSQPVVLGQTPFGLIGVRMAKTIGIHDGGGTIRNSKGNVDEEGPNGCFRKPARWCDYSGPIAPGIVEGITLMDHPQNPNHPTHFHVRADGWMGACLTYEAPRTVMPGTVLRLRYGLYVHRGAPVAEYLGQVWAAFAATQVDDLWDDRTSNP